MRKLTAKQKRLLREEFNRLVKEGVEYPDYWDVPYEILLDIDNINPCEIFSQNVEIYFYDLNMEKEK